MAGSSSAGYRVNDIISQVEIAQLAGVSRETVNKSMSDFARRGWIKFDGPSVVIRNPERPALRAR
jgi:CRP/FNR family cyclic AMP-dependent transcriptional regulator